MGVAAVFVALLTAATALADVTVCPTVANGECSPRGLAVDFETGNLYVADATHNRVEIFEENGKKPGTPASFPFTAPKWIAVDNVASSPSHHDLYLSSGFTVKKLSPTGTALGEFGEKGDGTPAGCQLEHANDPVAVGPNGDVYLADSYEKSAGVFANRVVKFNATGGCVGEVALFEEGEKTIHDLAVDSAGNSYVTVSGEGGVIRKYGSSGNFLPGFEDLETSGLAVDDADNLFAAQRGEKVDGSHTVIHFFTEYSASGAILHRFAYAPRELPGFVALAAHHSADGDLYASDGESVNYLSLPKPGPVFFPEPCLVKNEAPGSVRATLFAEVNPEGKATTLKGEVVTQAQWKEAGESFNSPGKVVVQAPLGGSADFELHEATVKVELLAPETTYHCRIVATNADSGPEGTIGKEGTFKTGPPFDFGPAWSAEVTQTAATIYAEGNPEGALASGQIEYISDAQYQANGGTFAGAQLSSPPLDYGNGEGMVLGLDEDNQPAHLAGLAPGTLYHYRLRAFNEGHSAGLVCPEEAIKQGSCPELEHTFRTYPATEPRPDDRGYELVSPGEKNSAEVGGPPNGRGFIETNSSQVFAGAPSGNAITYTSWTSFGNAKGAPATSQYISTRNEAAGSWETENISPFGFQSNLFVPPYLGFSEGLEYGAVKAGGNGEAPLAAGCPAGVEALYLHEASGALRCLTTEAPPGAGPFGYFFTFGGASEDGSRAFFKSSVSYAGAPTGSLYETHEGHIQPVSILPGQSAAVATGSSAFGARSNESSQTGQTFLRHAISADGSRVIWTHIPTSGPSELLMRIDGTKTIQLDEKRSGGGTSGNGLFWAASKDDSVVYFTSPNKLTSGAKAETGKEDLYRFQLGFEAGEEPLLTDLTSGAGKGLVPGDVQGVLGASDDGSRIYFVARAALPAEANAAGQPPKAGEDNLYLYDAGEEKTSFIGILSGKEDNGDWETQPKSHTARVTPDGEHLAFLSVEAKALSGYDNTLAKSEGRFGGGKECRIAEAGNLIGTAACPEAFLYDAQTKALRCASCNPSGARPLGPATLPGWTNMAEGPRYLSDDGSRLFFESFDRLLPADESLERDIYEFELAGAGSCSTANPNFDPASGGCLFLLSSGHSSDENHLIDASASGRDVFFSTRDRILPGWDTNENYDLYDYREGGGFPERAEAAVCGSSESCKPPVTPAPSPPAPATPSFSGPGNPKPKPHKKHHKKKHSKHKKKAKKHKKHADKNGRAGR